MMSDWNIRRDIVEYARRAYEKGLVAATDGNLSHRVRGDLVLVTPSGFSLGELKPDDLCCVDLNGRVVSGPHKATSEVPMHTEIYRQRPDVNAIVHTHAPMTNAFSFAGLTLDPCVIPEVVASLGRVPTAPYSTPSCAEGAAAVRELIREHDAVILERHGLVTVGETMRKAYFKTDKVEHAATVLLASRQLGRVVPLSADELGRLADVCAAHGWCSREFILRACRAPS